MQKVFAYMEEHAMIHAGDKVIAGVSGGADSMCLLFVLLDYRRLLPFSLTVAHVEHGVRGQESIGDARFVEKICREHKIDYRLVSCQVVEIAKREKLSVEEAGRRARYEAFERIREEMGADKIAVAHNQDDQAETVLFQIARGSGLRGAGGIRPEPLRRASFKSGARQYDSPAALLKPRGDRGVPARAFPNVAYGCHQQRTGLCAQPHPSSDPSGFRKRDQQREPRAYRGAGAGAAARAGVYGAGDGKLPLRSGSVF